ncbi:hypothetical protein F511_20035 [Dorcoceras hygrometricum]|uniref:Uncharacterized protein n=1 Tax=Dorcoceras hygrometricum TaxID=472368 RepID=A0A2Z7B0A8_9LAMI|nr:hypothetical protein F511_20035 [Dorcoceras hygrometricum]
MIVDLIGIYGLKGPYCTLTTTDWFLQALSVIPRGSWGDVARRFTMIRWAVDRSDLIGDRSYDEVSVVDFPLLRGKTVILHWGSEKCPKSASRLPSSLHTPPPPPPRVAGIRSGRFDEENPFVQNSSVLLVQADEGVSVLVVDRIGNFYRNLLRRADVIVTTVGARHKCHQGFPGFSAGRGGESTGDVLRG